jgi:hypothetical protein
MCPGNVVNLKLNSFGNHGFLKHGIPEFTNTKISAAKTRLGALFSILQECGAVHTTV